LELWDQLLRNGTEGDVGDGENDHVGVADGGAGISERAAGVYGPPLTGRGVFDVAHVMCAALQVVGDAHAHLPARADDGDLELLFGHAP
jgi:hypothetical protein